MWIFIWWWTFVPYIYAIADGGPINLISGGNSKGCHGKNTLSLCPADFMVLDMGEEEDDTPTILGRSFLNTTNVIIYVGSGQVHFQFPGEKVCRYFNSYTTYEQPKKTRYRRRHRSFWCQRNQPPRNEWEEDEEPKEVMKDEPTSPKTSPQTKQVWKEKVTSSSESPSQEVQSSMSPSLGPTDAPKEWTR